MGDIDSNVKGSGPGPGLGLRLGFRKGVFAGRVFDSVRARL